MNRKELFVISMAIFLTILAWIMFEAYKVSVKIQTEKEELSIVPKKIEFDTSVLQILKNKKSP